MQLFRFHTLFPGDGDIGTVDAVVCNYCRDMQPNLQTWGWLLTWANPQRTSKPVIECCQCGHAADCEPIDHTLTPPVVGREATPGEYVALGYDYQREG